MLYLIKRWWLYMGFGLIASNIPFLLFGPFFGAVGIFISAIALAIADKLAYSSTNALPGVGGWRYTFTRYHIRMLILVYMLLVALIIREI